MEDDLNPEVKELRSQLALERQTSYTLEQKLKSLQRDSNLESQQLKLKLQAEQEKTKQLESFISSFSSNESTFLQIQNSILQSKVNSLEKDYEDLKLRLFEDFSNKDTHISSLSEANQILEEELKSYQELSLTKNKAQKLKLNELEDVLLVMQKHNEDLSARLSKQAESYEEEIERLKTDLETCQNTLELRKKEVSRTHEKLEFQVQSNEKLSNDISELEEKLRNMESENERLISQIKNNDRRIKSLSQEFHNINEDLQDTKAQEIESLQKELNSVKKQLKSSTKHSQTILQSRAQLEENLTDLKSEFQKKTESFEKEKKSAFEQIFSLRQTVENLEKTFKEKEENIRVNKDEIIKDLQERLIVIKQEKSELENTLQELQDQIQVSRPSLGNEISLNDELMQVRESYSSRCSTPRNFMFDVKKTDKLQIELSEKELQIQILKSENNSLKNQIENLVPTLLIKHPEHQALLAEKIRIETEFELAKECWVKENSSLREVLEETENIVINANLRYAEAATDRDLYYKMYLDFKKNNKKKTWFTKKN